MSKYYVYRYCDPITLQPFYIGKGSGKRYLHHLSETKENTENFKKWAYIQGIRNKNLEPIVEIVSDSLTEDAAYELEEKLIKQFGRKDLDDGGILTNLCAVAKPPRYIWTEDRREAARKRATGRIASKTMREKCRAATSRRIVSEITKKKISTKAKERSSNPMLGKKHSEETRNIMREKAKQRKAKPKIECSHCKKFFDIGNYTKSHGEKCRLRLP